MIKKILAIIVIFYSSCSGNNYRLPETALDAGRDFIRASLDGDFKKAELLILEDSANHALFNSYKLYYSRMATKQKNGYKTASYEINKLTDLNDSTTLINYSNSYMHQPMEIKVVKNKGNWYIDFKHSYAENDNLK